MNMHGKVGSTFIYVIAGIKKYPIRVVSTATNVLAKNMNASAIPSTKANFVEFFKMRRKE